MSKCGLQSNFMEITLQEPYLNCTPAWVFSSKFAAYFQSTFYQEYLWVAASEYRKIPQMFEGYYFLHSYKGLSF